MLIHKSRNEREEEVRSQKSEVKRSKLSPVAYHLLLLFFLPLATFHSPLLYGQSTNAAITGQVTDPTKAMISDAKIAAINTGTNLRYGGATDRSGSYVITSLPPGNYRIEVEKLGFKTIIKPDVTLHVQDRLEINFEMALGSASETITVSGGAPLINTESAAVSTVVDRNFAENLPMNGRSFQTLIQLTPGVVLTASNQGDGGQFSVNGQRSASNYWMVDGVSANIGVGASGTTQGNGTGGALPAFSVQGGTNNLVSVDAMQEFRIQTSTYAPEFGRTPSGQISIVTRSGANQFHGTVFDYLRNDKLDANDWFADRNKLKKPEERQNDFGGTFSGPIIRDRTFFFFSYEGLRLRLPSVVQSTVPSLNARKSAIPIMQPFLNAYPLPDPNAPDNNGISPFNASFSNASSLNATSLRIDHRINDKLALFGRYNYAPSKLVQRPPQGIALSVLQSIAITTQTGTLGATWSASPSVVNDLRFNYSRTSAQGFDTLDNFGGAVPTPVADFNVPSPFQPQNSFLEYAVFGLSGFTQEGKLADNLQQQFNLVDNITIQKGSHGLKFGADYRRLMPTFNPASYSQLAASLDMASAESGQLFFGFLEQAKGNVDLLLQNLGVFAQDTWRINPKLTLTYGLRWDVDFAPSTRSGPNLPAVTNFANLSQLALAPNGTAPFATTYGNVAPRVGVAYQLSTNPRWGRVLRGGFGVFYDLATQEAGQVLSPSSYPFGATALFFGGTYPLSGASTIPPPITVSELSSGGQFWGFDPNLKLPYTLEWNLAFEQALGAQQSLSISYVGAAGRRLIATEEDTKPNANFSQSFFVRNAGTSDYDAMQIQFQRRLSHGLQVLSSYTWAHSIDTGSASSANPGGNNTFSNIFSRQLGAGANRGSSDFDIRHAASIGLTYDIPVFRVNAFLNSFLNHWSLENVFQARSAPPVDVSYGFESAFLGNGGTIRPNVEPGIPLYLYGSQYPGGKAFNVTPNQGGAGCIGPFCPPPTDPVTHQAASQGNLGRNTLRGFGAWQWDFAVHRDFLIRESLRLQFRVEMFNVLNHPNFGQPSGDLANPSQFGLSTQTLGQSLNFFNSGGGGFSPLYQLGGPRSIQVALKLQF